MDKTGIEEYFIEKDGKRLHFGFTTGTCAAAAAKAATILLLSDTAPQTVSIRTPKGIDLTLPVLEPVRGDGFACCAIRLYQFARRVRNADQRDLLLPVVGKCDALIHKDKMISFRYGSRKITSSGRGSGPLLMLHADSFRRS